MFQDICGFTQNPCDLYFYICYWKPIYWNIPPYRQKVAMPFFNSTMRSKLGQNFDPKTYFFIVMEISFVCSLEWHFCCCFYNVIVILWVKKITFGYYRAVTISLECHIFPTQVKCKRFWKGRRTFSSKSAKHN